MSGGGPGAGDAGGPAPVPLLPTPRRPAAELRRRTLIASGAVGLVLLGLLLLASLLPPRAVDRPVVLAARPGSRLEVDGEPQAQLGTDGNHLLHLPPGTHTLTLTLRDGQVVSQDIEVAPGEGSLRLALRWDRTWGRWSLVDLDASAEVPEAAAGGAEATAEPR